MNIFEAIKTGKHARRKSLNGDWVIQPGLESLLEGYVTFESNDGKSRLRMGVKNMMADDWEVKEKKVEVTYEKLKEAIQNNVFTVNHDGVVNGIAKELGLIE